MTSTPSADAPRRIAVVGTGLIGTSIAMAASRTGRRVTGWDIVDAVGGRAEASGALRRAPSLAEAVAGAELVIVSTPIASLAATVVEVLAAAPDAVVTDAGSIKSRIVSDVDALLAREGGSPERFVPGHPMGGSERSGPEHASASLVDGIVWALAPTERSDPGAVDVVERFVLAIGARPVRMSPARHDRLVAFVSHLPQVASTALMSLAATEEADEPDILLLAAGGFRDLTRLAASNPALWSDILVANGIEVARAIDLYIDRLGALRDQVSGARDIEVERTFDQAKRARLRLATKPHVRAGVAVMQLEIPDRPGALAELTSGLAEGDVNIEDLQIVHSSEGGRGVVYLTVAADLSGAADRVLRARGFDPAMLA
jgi:prephenate dehydrogenase